jgi:TolB protein
MEEEAMSRQARTSGVPIAGRRVRRAGALVALALALSAPAAHAQVRGLITGPGETAFPIAVTQLQGGEGEAGRQFTATLTRNLDLSGLFRILDPASFIGDGGGSRIEEIKFEDWATVGARLLVAGRMSSSGGELTI